MTAICVEGALEGMFVNVINDNISLFHRPRSLYSSENMHPLGSENHLGDGPFVGIAKQLLSEIDNPSGPDHWATKFALCNAGDVDLLRRLLEANTIALTSIGRA